MFSSPKDIMSKELCRHFIKGYFDGDGSIILLTKDSRNTVFEITSTNIKFLFFCKEIFTELGCYNINIEKGTGDLVKNLIIKNKPSILKIRDFLYSNSNSNFSLKRKKTKFNKIKM